MLKKKTATPTIEERLAGAAAVKASALSIFDVVHDDLLRAEAEAVEVAKTVEGEIERLREIAVAAWGEAADSAASRDKVAQILGKA